MTKNTFQTNPESQNQTIRKYYQFQSKIYDATRWSFLFGRNEIIDRLPIGRDEAIQVLEIGCGTGHNLQRLANRFPNATLTGLDVSADMLAIAGKTLQGYGDRITLIEKPYQEGETTFLDSMDVILFSYSLTMINPQWASLIRQAKSDLKTGGIIAVTDFHDSQFQWFKTHMGNNHVRMDGHLLPLLKELFQPEVEEVKKAYLGVWEYLVFLGRGSKVESRVKC